MNNYKHISIGINETLGIHPVIQLDVMRYILNPTKDNWSRIHNYMINDKQTLFRAVCQRESSFRIAAVENPITGARVWMKIPDVDLILDIIRENTYQLDDRLDGQRYKLN